MEQFSGEKVAAHHLKAGGLNVAAHRQTNWSWFESASSCQPKAANVGGDCGPIRVRLHPTSGRENTEIVAAVAACFLLHVWATQWRHAAMSAPRCLPLKVLRKVCYMWVALKAEHYRAHSIQDIESKNFVSILVLFRHKWLCPTSSPERKNDGLNRYKFICRT